MSLPAIKFPQGIIDRSAVVVQEMYLASDAFRVWTQGRIFRDHPAMVPRSTPWPAMYVTAGVDRPEPGINCGTLFYSITTWFVWHQGPVMGPEDTSIASVALAAKGILLGNGQLVSDRFDDALQADKLSGFDPKEYEGDGEVGGKFCLLHNFTANYVRMNLPADTYEPPT